MAVADLARRENWSDVLLSYALSLFSRDIHFLEGDDDLTLLLLLFCYFSLEIDALLALLGLPSSTKLIAPSRAPFKACI